MKNKLNRKDSDFKQRILIGLNLSFEKLVQQKKKCNGKLVFSQNGEIVTVNARDINLSRCQPPVNQFKSSINQ